MIVVIADDFTGAAEMGGVALRFGLSAEVQAEFDPRVDVDLVAVDADTRSCTAAEAARRATSVARLCREAAVGQVFKKVDSVLRGRVIAELTALLDVFGKSRAILLPANPGLGRVIRGGHYYVSGQPLHRTDFSEDPEYPARTSDVLGLLGPSRDWKVYALAPNAVPPDRGILIGDATCEADLTRWASRIDDSTLPAGAAEFFAAFLRTKGLEQADNACADVASNPYADALFVSGSTSAYSRSFCKGCEAQGIPVLRLPDGLFRLNSQSPHLVCEWADDTVRALKTHSRVIVAIDRPLSEAPGLPQVLCNHLGELVERVINQQPLRYLFAEGGATAVALVRRLGWKRLRVVRELAPGVVSMQVEDRPGPLLTMKPGSYAWPDVVWKGD